MNGLKVAHIVNPIFVSDERELSWQQPITYRTMKLAKSFAETNYGMQIEHHACVYPEDEEAIPEGFERTKDLDRSVQDIKPFPMRRKLPLFKDILDRLYDSTEAEYLIQTNVDIGLMPHFYTSINRLIKLGYEALIINKRIIPGHYRRIDQIPDMYSELGSDHNGYDCFVFKREIYPRFVMGDNCMGIPWSETSLAVNMVAFGRNLTVLKHPHLTFHIGDSRTWIPQDDYRLFNTEAFAKVLTTLLKNGHNIIRHEVVAWLLKKMVWEIDQHERKGAKYPQVCYDLVKQLTFLF